MKNHTKNLVTAAIIGMVASTPAIAQEGGFFAGSQFSASVGFTSDYVFRGISQSDEDPAVQGSFDYTLPLTASTSLYAGIWGSNVDFNDGDQAHLETDFYAGINHTIDSWTFDISSIYYAYPGASGSVNYDFWEMMGTIGYDFGFASLAGSVNWSPEYFGNSGDSYYYQAGISVPAPEAFDLSDLSFDATIGRQMIDNNAAFGVDDYTTWSVGANYQIQKVTLTAQYVDTNIDANQCNAICDGRFVLSASTSF